MKVNSKIARVIKARHIIIQISIPFRYPTLGMLDDTQLYWRIRVINALRPEIYTVTRTVGLQSQLTLLLYGINSHNSIRMLSDSNQNDIHAIITTRIFGTYI